MGKQARVCSPNCHLPPPPKAALRADRFLCNSLPWIPLSPTAHPTRPVLQAVGGSPGWWERPPQGELRTVTFASSEGVGRPEGCRLEETDVTCSHPGPRTLCQRMALPGANPQCPDPPGCLPVLSWCATRGHLPKAAQVLPPCSKTLFALSPTACHPGSLRSLSLATLVSTLLPVLTSSSPPHPKEPL